MSVLRGIPQDCGGNSCFIGLWITESLAFDFDISVCREESEGTFAVLMKVRSEFLCVFGGALIAVFESGFGNFSFDKLTGCVGECDGFIEFVFGGRDVGTDEVVEHDVGSAVDLGDLTLCVKWGRLFLGGLGISTVSNLP